jgi:hypothetical protein
MCAMFLLVLVFGSIWCVQDAKNVQEDGPLDLAGSIVFFPWGLFACCFPAEAAGLDEPKQPNAIRWAKNFLKRRPNACRL